MGFFLKNIFGGKVMDGSSGGRGCDSPSLKRKRGRPKLESGGQDLSGDSASSPPPGSVGFASRTIENLVTMVGSPAPSCLLLLLLLLLLLHFLFMSFVFVSGFWFQLDPFWFALGTDWTSFRWSCFFFVFFNFDDGREDSIVGPVYFSLK